MYSSFVQATLLDILGYTCSRGKVFASPHLEVKMQFESWSWGRFLPFLIVDIVCLEIALESVDYKF